MVVAESRAAVAVEMWPPLLRRREFSARGGIGVGVGGSEVVFGFIVFVLAVDDNSPAGGEGVVVGVEVVGFELDAAKDGGDGQGLAIGQMDDGRGHWMLGEVR